VLLLFQNVRNVIEDDLCLGECLGAGGNAHLDVVVDGQGGIPVIDYLNGVIHPADQHFGHLGAVIAEHSVGAAAPDHQPPGDGNIGEGDGILGHTAAE